MMQQKGNIAGIILLIAGVALTGYSLVANSSTQADAQPFNATPLTWTGLAMLALGALLLVKYNGRK